VLQNREQQKGIQFSHTRGSQKHDEQMTSVNPIFDLAKFI